MAITIDDFGKIWASTSPLTPYEFSESNYKEGWNFIGGTPPSRQMWDFLQKNNDEKLKYIVDNYLALSGGTMTGQIILADGGNPLSTAGGKMTGAIVGDPLTLTADDGNGNTASLVINANGDITGVTPAAGDNSTKLSTTAFVQALATILMPTGCVQAFAGSVTPDGWLLCDGSAVSRTDYAALYAVIGDTYGAGDGSTTFDLPNLVDKFVEGSATSGTEKSAGLPNITGQIQVLIPMNADPNYSSELLQIEGSGCAVGTHSANGNYFNGIGITTTPKNKTLDIDASRSSSVYGNSTTVQPPALTMKYIIKY